jgi:hypothetical protein
MINLTVIEALSPHGLVQPKARAAGANSRLKKSEFALFLLRSHFLNGEPVSTSPEML